MYVFALVHVRSITQRSPAITNDIGTPDPKLEPRTTSLDK